MLDRGAVKGLLRDLEVFPRSMFRSSLQHSSQARGQVLLQQIRRTILSSISEPLGRFSIPDLVPPLQLLSSLRSWSFDACRGQLCNSTPFFSGSRIEALVQAILLEFATLFIRRVF